MSGEWFTEWFESKEYLNLYRHRSISEAEIFTDTILRITDIHPPAKILDSACGAGRYSISFAKLGFDVTGFDLSSFLLDKARKEARNHNLEINFFRSDIRYVNLDENFDLILNLFTSFGYFESDKENFEFFRNVFSKLNQEGYLVFDYFNPFFVRSHLIPESRHETEAKTIIETRRIQNGRVNKIIQVLQNGQEQRYEESVKIYNPDEILNQFEKIGFSIDSILGSYEGAKYVEDTSERFIVVLKKT